MTIKKYTVHRDFVKFQPAGFQFGNYDDPECFEIIAASLDEAKAKCRNEHNKNPWYFKFKESEA